MEKIRAFTLAETLITLLIIGVVAALTIPALLQIWKDKMYVSAYKKMHSSILNGFGQMVAEENITGYDSTEKFVQEMGKYFKIAQTCGNDDLAKCFAEKITTEDDEFELSKLKKSSNLGKDSDSWPTDTNVNGIIFDDGTSMLIAYNKDGCTYNKVSKEETIRNCVAIVFDLDGPSKGGKYAPLNDKNEATSDIGLFNASFSTSKDCASCFTVVVPYSDHNAEISRNCTPEEISAACGDVSQNYICSLFIKDDCEKEGYYKMEGEEDDCLGTGICADPGEVGDISCHCDLQ